ncbi:conserved hypothetical protein [Ricinus communis]|uniref:Uncharacterized protein n=1 Tax=Ricinus communis TaxID=3988 RepID=B9RYH7_RICCO|nr:conserved hypothetical protein [Ricinus communis]|eukprot:XP_002518761.1 uncharacterized protein LOC8275298 [Ricinus communis]
MEEMEMEMENENLVRNIPSVLTDHQLTAGGAACVSQKLTRSCSDSSAITVDSFKDLGPSTVWTDEKHSLYIDSLEAAFVNQLHHSIALRGSLQEILLGPYSSRALPKNSRNSSHKLMVLRDGSWQNINSRRNKPLLESTADSHYIQEIPCTSHFSSAGKRRIVACHDLHHGGLCSERIHAAGNSPVSCGLARSSGQHSACSLCYCNSDGIALEVSDQNFVDDDGGEKSSCMATVKKLKIVGTDASSYDKIVPLRNSNISEVSTASQACREREEEVHQELLSENPDTFVYPKSDLHYFLRES